MNNDRLKAGVTQATAAFSLFKPGMDITAFQEGLTKADEAIQSFKVASGMVINYPQTSAQESTITEEEAEATESPSVSIPKGPMGSIIEPGQGKLIPMNVGRSMASVIAKSKTQQKGGRKTHRQKQKKRRTSTHKHKRI
jgi:hypothetical protein